MTIQDNTINRPENKKGASSGTEAASGLLDRATLPPTSVTQPQQRQFLGVRCCAQPLFAMPGRAFLSASAHRKTTHAVEAGDTPSEGADLQGLSTPFAHRHTACFKNSEVCEISDKNAHYGTKFRKIYAEEVKIPNQTPIFLSHKPFLVNIKTLF